MLAVFALALGGIQRLAGPALLAVLAFALLGACLLAPQRLWALIRRSRFLFLALFILDAFFTAGDRVWVLAWVPAPTWEGLRLTLEQAARLAGLLCMVALLLEKMPLPRIVAGLHVLMRPLGLVGFDRTHAAVRLTLVLDWLERRPVLRWRDWLMATEPQPLPPIRFEMQAWQRRDTALALLVLGAGVFLLVGT